MRIDHSVLAMPLGESTNVYTKSRFMVYIRFYFKSHIPEELLFCEALKNPTEKFYWQISQW